jgi:hypothetical protein
MISVANELVASSTRRHCSVLVLMLDAPTPPSLLFL